MTQFTYQNLTMEKLEFVMKEMFNPNSVNDSRRFDLRQFRDYPQTPSESFK